MIDEKKLLKEINGMWKGYVFLPVDRFVEVIERQPKIGEWIPCSERLPEESLNSVIGLDEYRQRCCFVQYYGGRWILGNDIEPVKIIAWQPLPAPYEVKSDE